MSNKTVAMDVTDDFPSFDDIFGKAEKDLPPLSGLQHIKSKEDDKEPKAGEVCQYSLYRNGYMASNATIKNLSNGCYDIKVNSDGVYVTPLLPPTGILFDLPDLKSNDVMEKIETFWNSEKDYKEGNEYVIGGATFKSGVLLWGPQGSGKSSIIKLASSKLVKRNGIVFFADINPAYVMEFLENFTRIEPDRKCIVILEDLDSLIRNYGDSGYLEMLDSAKSINNVLFIATTNYPEKLEPRIYCRPGRFAEVIKVDMPTPIARKAFLEAILKKHDDVEYIVDHSNGFSIDHLSALVNSVYRQKKDLKNEIVRLRSLFKVPKSDGDEPSIGLGS